MNQTPVVSLPEILDLTEKACRGTNTLAYLSWRRRKKFYKIVTSGDADLKPFQIELNFFLHLARRGCTGVKHSANNPKVEGSNPGIAFCN